jgi:hypothetical protein
VHRTIDAKAMAELSVKELRAALKQANVAYDGCVEKSDLIALFQKHNLSAGSSAAAAPAVDVSEATPEAPPSWAGMSTKELKKLLTSRGVSVEGCFEHADFVERAEQQLAGSSICASSSDGGAMGQLRRENETRREEELKAKRALAAKQEALERRDREAKRAAALQEEAVEVKPTGDGGWVVDMFGVRRGACTRDGSCWRFDPPPLTAGRVLGSNTCRRCNKKADDHEHCGSKAVGKPNEPDMVDEFGRCYKLRVSGGGGAHDSATYTYELMPGVEPPPKDERFKKKLAPVAMRTGAAPSAPTATITANNKAAEAEAAAQAARLRAAREID